MGVNFRPESIRCSVSIKVTPEPDVVEYVKNWTLFFIHSLFYVTIAQRFLRFSNSFFRRILPAIREFVKIASSFTKSKEKLLFHEETTEIDFRKNRSGTRESRCPRHCPSSATGRLKIDIGRLMVHFVYIM